ncbi:hypothetical protein [Tautonia rosea]|uniref:hypothetical protein n=1 Tax=Tautonia rosea TaxID=2728037 RepID=UPI001473BDEA|nr:hypothetical protein [Tautonia rosea]
MIARRPRSPASRRRGVVLILVLSMLGLLAVIGVSFAAFSGQARSAARNYTKKLNRPLADDLVGFGIRQLINDTTNPMSALYGHGLKRDMYGNDAVENGFYDRNPNGSFPTVGNVTVVPVAAGEPARWDITTNIPSIVGYNFTGWILTIPGTGGTVAQTFEVVNGVNSGPTYVLEITGSHRPGTTTTGLNGVVGMSIPVTGAIFTLDGRYRHGFNGTGMAALAGNVDQAMTAGNDPGNRNPGQFANFRVSGGILEGNAAYTPRPFNVNLLPVDEDYDAPDLENWFLAAQSADGRTIIPSFHRPGILAVDAAGLSDMRAPHPSSFPPGAQGTPEYRRSVRAISKILTPRPVDHPTAGFPDLLPDVNGQITYPVDNDGDGINDSVWLDLGYPVQRSDDGTLYKPLFSFMVVGTNGRLPLNTAGNLNGRLLVDDPTTPNFDEAGLPLYDHASHLGYSPSEINPQYALQNAFDATDDGAGNNLPDDAKPLHQQFDNASHPVTGFGHIPVALSQLRSLLTGTRINLNNDSGELNTILINGNLVRFYNNTVDNADFLVARNGGQSVDRFTNEAVPGRWGEPDAIPPEMRQFPYNPVVDPISPALDRALNFSSSRVGALDIPNPVRPGQSPFPQGQYLTDGIDNNLDTFDFFPGRTPRGGNSAGGPEAGPSSAFDVFAPSDAHDAANMPILASERIRRFVTPIDPTGIGLVARYNQSPVPGNPFIPADIGPDGRGRVSFRHYFRPPGVPLDADDFSTFDPVRPERSRLIRNSGTPVDPSYAIARTHHNRYHGFHAHLFPAGNNGFMMGAMPFDLSNEAGAIPFPPRNALGESNPPTDLFGSGAYVGTFSTTINANPFGRLRREPLASPAEPYLGPQFVTNPTTAVHAYPLGSPLLNDPNEMNLYWPDSTDAPFGPNDLEWLYRFGDVDGLSLQSRLSDLAPISFVHAVDAQTRRRLFSVDTWDRIDYSFANDNPIDRNVIYPPAVVYSPGDPSQIPPAANPVPIANARFAPGVSASFEALNQANPGLTHGGRRINLNHPFPHSYNPRESVRQKWISETYETLKVILPPHAIDTPHELAKLGQFVVNIVDFRDPDNAITIWENPDVSHLPARRVSNAGNDYDLPPSIHLQYRSDGTLDPNFDPTLPLVHYGMEYQPVALNEVLGFQFSYAEDDGSGTFINTRANRLFIEMVNMLTEPGQPATNASDLDLEGWDFVLVKEDPNTAFSANNPYFHPVFTRPDPITGQIPNAALADDERPVVRDDPGVEAQQFQAKPVLVGSGEEPARSETAPDLAAYQQSYRDSGLPVVPPVDNRVPAIESNGDPTYFVFTGARTASGGGTDIPAINEVDRPVDDPGDAKREFATDDWALIPDVDDPAFSTPTGGQGLFFWLYLRRPANPLLPPGPDNPMVVVDSIRFPFSSSNGAGRVNGMGNAEQATQPTQPIYSVQRAQPFRGGQLVPDPEDPTVPLFLYGSSEQVRPAEPRDTGDDEGYRTFFAVRPGEAANDRYRTTNNIYETVGGQNLNSRFQNFRGPDDPHEAYDYFPFNDRDFMSVAELMLVPASPPGLFTKQFAEWAPSALVTPGPNSFADIPPTDISNTSLWEYTPAPDIGDPVPPPLDPATDPVPGASPPLPHQQVRTYPYLAHEFYYTSDPSEIVDPTNVLGRPNPTFHLVGGPTSAGWYKMFEMFEVPTPVLDAIGPVAQGLNFDWFRQDRRPGQINLNLILDEEAFFGVIDDPRLLDATNLPRSLIANDAELPQIVTAVGLDGRPLDNSVAPFIRGSYPMGNRGFTVFSTDATGYTLNTAPTSASFPWMRMKRSFADFLKQRHGGSGFLFAYGDGVTGTQGLPASPTPNVARDRPYRSLSNYDIQRTLMRPATMDPSDFTVPALSDATLRVRDPGLKESQWDFNETIADLLDPGYSYLPPDPTAIGSTADVRLFYSNPVRTTPSGIKPIVPPIPPRRWFQLPDWADPADATTASNASVGSAQVTDYTPITNTNTALSSIVPTGTHGNYPGLFPLWSYFNTGEEMRDRDTGASPQFGGSIVGQGPAGTTFNQPDGTTVTVPEPTGNGNTIISRDMRRHPYYRTEMLQKVSNLTTPRTHQYAVWVTVGLFEVVRPGDRAQLIPDELGPELGVASGSNVRYRSFFVLDRTRATGFNPLRPGDYRDVIVYSRRIE